MDSRQSVTILLVEDNPDHAELIQLHLRRAPAVDAHCDVADTLGNGLRALSEKTYDAVLLDLYLPDSAGMATVSKVLEGAVSTAVIVLSSLATEELALQALQAGAQDYLPKDQLDGQLLARCIRYAIERKGTERNLQASRRALRDRAEDLERLNERLQRRNRELNEFTYIASHDLREPVRQLVTFSQKLRRNAGTSLPATASEDLEWIMATARRLEQIVVALRALADASLAEIKRERVALQQCVEGALQHLAQQVQETGAQVSMDDLPPVEGDVALLTLLFQNLLGNALKYCHEKPVVRVTATEQEEGWVLGVRDKGIGIDPAHYEGIFAPLERLHARREFGGGTGIGLAICRKIVVRHGGRIWVESEPGGGSHFRFTLGENSTVDTHPAGESG